MNFNVTQKIGFKLLFTLLIQLTIILNSNAQSFCTIGAGATTTTSTGSDPIDGYYNFFRYQTVYTAAELTAGGMTSGASISGLGFSIAGDYGGGNMPNYTIRLAHTTATNSASHDAAALTQVRNPANYNPTVVTAGNFDMIPFDLNFTWNGTDNILVDICAGSMPYTSPYGQVRADALTSGSRYVRADAPATSQCAINTGTTNGNRPQIRFAFTAGSACSGTPAPGNTLASSSTVCSGASVNLSLQNSTSGTGVSYQWQTADDAAFTVNVANVGTSSATYTATVTASKYYRCQVTCSGNTGTSTPVLVTLGTCCNYTFVLTDSYGDGWNGATMQVRQGTTVITTLGPTFTGGTSLSVPVSLLSGTSYNLFYNAGGSYPGEVGIQIQDNTSSTFYTLAAGAGTVGTQLTTWTQSCPAPCSGTPNPGTVTSSVASVCSGVGFTLTATGFSQDAGNSRIWQTAPSAAGPWTDVLGQTGATYNATLTANTWYRLKVSCSFSGLDATSNEVGVALSSYCPCIPTYTFGKTAGDLISNISITGTTLANNTGTAQTNPAYTYFSGAPNLTATLNAGTSYNVNVAVGTWGDQNIRAWIDFNNNAVFETSEIIGTTIIAPGQLNTGPYPPATFTVSLPCNPTPGTYRMRIRSAWQNTPDPCLNYGYGETEDYDVTVAPPPPCPQPSAGVVSNPSAYTLDVAWTAGCTETQWDIYAVPAGSAAPTGASTPTHPGIMANPTTIGSLTSNTVYDVYVRAVCTAGSVYSLWSGPYNGTTLATCFPVTGITIPSATITASSATFSWTAPVPGTVPAGYNWKVVAAGAGSGGTAVASGVAMTTTATATGLSGQTSYDVWIQSDCGGGDLSTWSGPGNFTTRPANDLPCNAITLSLGTSPSYSNSGATVDAGEVAPIGGNCDNQINWCNNTLENTVWFKFVAPSSGRVSIAAPGWDNQLALYSVTNCADYSTYSLLAANDDGGPGFDALITGASCLVSGQTYYIQLDGYSSTGSTTITITDLGNDMVAPSFGVTCPTNINVTVPAGSCTVPVSWTPPTATDNCPAGQTIIASNYNPGASFGNGTTTIIYTATDAQGNVGTCSFNVIVSGGCNTWTGAANSDWHNAANWSAAVVPTCGFDVIINPSANNPVISANASTRNLTINSGAGITVNAGSTLTLCGNWRNNGLAEIGLGKVSLTKPSGVILGGPSTFEDLEILANTSCNNAEITVRNELRLAGIFNNKWTRVNLVSTSAKTAYVYPQGTGYLQSNNNIWIQRYIPAGPDGTRLLANPIAVSNIGQWANDFSIFGANNVDATVLSYSGVWPNLWTYNETFADPNVNKGYFSYTSSSGATAPGKGYSARMYGLPKTLIVKGNALISKPVVTPLNITYTNSGTPASDGINLIGNPYMCPISWNAVKAANSGKTDGSVYYFSATGEYTGNFASWNGTVGTNGGQDVIPSSQGFFVKASNSASLHTLNFDNSMLVASSSNAFYKNDASVDNLLRLEVSNGAMSDEVVTYFSSEATEAFDASSDAYKFKADNPELPTLSTFAGTDKLSINNLPVQNVNTVVPVGLEIGATSSYTFRATEINFSNTTDVYLNDRKENKYYNLRTEQPSYNFTASEDLTNRFFIVFGKPEVVETQNLVKVYAIGNKVVVDFSRLKEVNADIQITNMLGQNIADVSNFTSTIYEFPVTNLDLSTLVVKVSNSGINTTQKVIVSNK